MTFAVHDALPLHVTPTSSPCLQSCLELFLLQLLSRLSLPLQVMSSK